jgi:hypothetical protein
MYREFDLTQAREFSDTAQAFETWQELRHRERSARGSMVWMKAKGIEYLHRSSYDDYGRRVQTTLGPRSPETESIRSSFLKAREDVKLRLKRLEEKMTLQAATNVARGIARLPIASARVIRAMDKAGLGPTRIKIVGTHALYAYEALAAILFESELTSMQDIDLLLNPRAPLRFISSEELSEETLLGVLKSADKSFELTRQPFRARDRNDFLVDIIKPQRNPPWRDDAFEAGKGDIQPAPIEGLAWRESAPAVEQIVIDSKGWPLIMAVPDPRVFAIHKYWLSNRAQRGAVKARRDRAQAFAVASLVIHELKHLPFDGRSLRMMPREVVAEAIAAFRKLPKPDAD